MVDSGRTRRRPRNSSRSRRPWLPGPRRSSGSRASRADRRARAAPPGRDPEEALAAKRTSSGPGGAVRADDRDVDLPVGDQARRLDRVRGRDLEAQRQRLGEQLPQHRQQQRLAQVVAGGDAQGGHPARRPAPPAGPQRGRLVEHPGQAASAASPAGLSRTPRPTFSNSATPKLLLDPAQLLRHGRGGLVQPPGGLADRPGLGDHQRVVQGGKQGGVHR